MNDNDFMTRYGPAALVTGASSGIGRSFAEILARMGMNLVLAARRVQRLEDLASRLQVEHRIQVKVCQVDLAQITASRQILAATAGIDIGLVVSNAGFGFKGPHAGNDPAAMTDL